MTGNTAEEEQTVISNYEIMRNQMRGEFVKYNQEKMIKKFSLRNDEGYIYILKSE